MSDPSTPEPTDDFGSARLTAEQLTTGIRSMNAALTPTRRTAAEDDLAGAIKRASVGSYRSGDQRLLLAEIDRLRAAVSVLQSQARCSECGAELRAAVSSPPEDKSVAVVPCTCADSSTCALPCVAAGPVARPASPPADVIERAARVLYVNGCTASAHWAKLLAEAGLLAESGSGTEPYSPEREVVIEAAIAWADAPDAYVKAIYGGDLYDAVAALRTAPDEQ
jgi:hypothetical protein